MKKKMITALGPRAIPIGEYRGKPAYRVPVRVSVHNPGAWLDPTVVEHLVIAQSPADAANWAREYLVTEPQTTITAFGPSGGKTERFVGWDTYIGNALFSADRSQQRLPFHAAE